MPSARRPRVYEVFEAILLYAQESLFVSGFEQLAASREAWWIRYPSTSVMLSCRSTCMQRSGSFFAKGLVPTLSRAACMYNDVLCMDEAAQLGALGCFCLSS